MTDLRQYKVIYEGRVREVYYVTATSKGEARLMWSDEEPVISEVLDGDVVSIKDVTDE